MYSSWEENAFYVESQCGGFVDWDEEFYICPECGEPVYACDWDSHQLEEFVCPICEWEGD